MPRKQTKNKSEKAKAAAENESEARFAYDGLDRVMHEKARLGILASLAAHERGLLFNDLKQLCALTDGNLSRHLGVLSDACLVEVWKGATGSRQQTMYRLTTLGRERFAEYISVLERVIEDAQLKQHQAEDRDERTDGWATA